LFFELCLVELFFLVVFGWVLLSVNSGGAHFHQQYIPLRPLDDPKRSTPHIELRPQTRGTRTQQLKKSRF
jgi:hypothetical protein